MRKKYVGIFTISIISIIILASVFAIANRSLDYDKTVVIDDRPDAEIISNTNFNAVKEVKLQELPEGASFFDTYQLQLWSGDKLLLAHVNPLFKFDEDMKTVLDISSPYSPYLDPKTDFAKNALYLMNPEDGRMEKFADTYPYNVVKCFLSPDRNKLLIFEAYNVMSADALQEVAASEGDTYPFTMDGYDNIKSRIRMYDFNIKNFSFIDEWETKYLSDKDDYGNTGFYNTFGGLSWSTDGKGFVYCEKTAFDEYSFRMINLDTNVKTEYKLQEGEKRFERVLVHGVSKDLKKVWFSGVDGYMEDSTGFDIGEAASSIYVVDFNNTGKGAQELVQNMIYVKVLKDENTIIYTKDFDPSNSTFMLYKYDMNKAQNKLIDEKVCSEFEISKDEERLIYVTSDDRSFEINMAEISSDLTTEKTILYKSSPDSYIIKGLSWSDDGTKAAVCYYKVNGMQNCSGQICVLALKEE